MGNFIRFDKRVVGYIMIDEWEFKVEKNVDVNKTCWSP